jgi:phosphoribosyl-dephospho-CoA transferase
MFLVVSLLSFTFLIPGYVRAEVNEPTLHKFSGNVLSFTKTSMTVVKKSENNVTEVFTFAIVKDTVINAEISLGVKVTVTYALKKITKTRFKRTALVI